MRLHLRLGRHRYEGLALDAEEQHRLAANLGLLDGLILDNQGTLTVGHSVAEAFLLMHILERAAAAQLRAAAPALGIELTIATDELAERSYRQWFGDSSGRDVDVEWPALLGPVDRLSPSFQD